MALSGSFNTTGYNSGDGSPDYLTFSWTATQNIANNTSTITWTVVVGGGVSSSYYNTLFQRYAKVGATEKSGDGYWTVYNGTQVFSGTETIQHASDGTGSFTATVKGSMESWNANYNTTKSQTFTLDQIPRAAEITSAPNFYETDSPVLGYSNPASTAATLSAAISLNSAGTSLACAYRSVSSTAGSYTFSLTTTEKNALRNATPNSKTMTVYFFLKSVIGSNTYYKSVARTFTVSNAMENRPTVTISSTAPDNTSIPSGNRSLFNGTYVQNISKLTASLTGSGKYGSSVSSYSSSINNVSYSGSSFATNVLTTAGSQTLSSTVTDSRGYTGTASTAISVAAYTEPYLSNVSIYRCDSSGTAQNNGTYVRISAVRNFASINSINKAIIEYRYKESTASSYPSSWTTLLNYTASGTTGTTTISGFTVTKVYNFQIRVVDYIGKGDSSTVSITVPSEAVTLHLKEGGKAVGLGTYATTDNTIETGWSIISTNTTPLQFKGALATYPLVQAKDVNVSYGAACAFGNAGGTTIVGAGESAGAALSGVGSDVEDLYLTADASIYLCPNSQTWSSRKTITLGTDGSITAPATITASAGYLKSTLNGNTVQIGSQNTSYCHITNSADKPFWFNKTIEVAGNVLPYNNNANTCGSSSKKWSGVYATQFYGSVAKLLWTNSANTYSTGTVSLNLSGYTHIIIGGWAWESEGYFQNVVKVGTYSIIGYTGVNTSTASNATTFLNCAYRQATVSTSGVTFTNGFMIYNGGAYTGWATRAVPKWIWGVNYGT